MNKEEIIKYCLTLENTYKDCPFPDDFESVTMKHLKDKKWFALIMDVSKNKLELEGDESMDVVNFKCDPILIDSLRNENGFFPAYHMNKEHWITVSLDDVCDEKIKMLLDISFELTLSK